MGGRIGGAAGRGPPQNLSKQIYIPNLRNIGYIYNLFGKFLSQLGSAKNK
jgi:hypothetical protein